MLNFVSITKLNKKKKHKNCVFRPIKSHSKVSGRKEMYIYIKMPNAEKKQGLWGCRCERGSRERVGKCNKLELGWAGRGGAD